MNSKIFLSQTQATLWMSPSEKLQNKQTNKKITRLTERKRANKYF